MLTSLFTFNGRLGRLSLQAAILALLILLFMVMAVLSFVITAMSLITPDNAILNNTGAHMPLSSQIVMAISALLLLIAFIVCTVNLHVRRLHDLNHSGWWLLLVVPIMAVSLVINHYPGNLARGLHIGMGLLSLGLLLYLLYAPGTAGSNRYGDPRATPKQERIMGWLFGVPMAIFSLLGWIDYFTAKYPYKFERHDKPLAAATTTDFKAPYPFTAQQLWLDLLNVAALPSDALDQTHIEQALGLQLHPLKAPSAQAIQGTRAGVDWYFSLRLVQVNFRDKPAHKLMFDWQNDGDDIRGTQPPTSLCILGRDTQHGLQQQGWTLNTLVTLDDNNYRERYVKDNTQSLTITFDRQSHCLKQLTIATPAEALTLADDTDSS